MKFKEYYQLVEDVETLLSELTEEELSQLDEAGFMDAVQTGAKTVGNAMVSGAKTVGNVVKAGANTLGSAGKKLMTKMSSTEQMRRRKLGKAMGAMGASKARTAGAQKLVDQALASNKGDPGSALQHLSKLFQQAKTLLSQRGQQQPEMPQQPQNQMQGQQQQNFQK